MTGYGVTNDWISEYEKFIDRKLKRFTLKVLYLCIITQESLVVNLNFLTQIMYISGIIGQLPSTSFSWVGIDKEVEEALLLWHAKTDRESVISMMYEAITDIFPGIEKCIKKDLSVVETCTRNCKLFIFHIEKSKSNTKIQILMQNQHLTFIP